jgi:hypothetical protein
MEKPGFCPAFLFVLIPARQQKKATEAAFVASSDQIGIFSNSIS